MNTELPPFPNLRNAILNLEKSLNCTYCYRVFADPYTLTTCGHTFCKYCITSFVSAQKANCPLCDLPNWLNQSQPNRQLKALLQNYEKLRCLLAIPDPKTPVRIQPRVEKKRKRKKMDLFESTTRIMEEEEPNGMHDTPSLVINPNYKIIPDNSEVINLHCTESLVQNIHSNELETRLLPNGLESCITQIDNDKLPYNDNAITRTSHSGENITVVTADTLHKSQSISIDHTSSLVLSQEINLNGLNLTQANSQEISLNQDIISRSDDLQKDGRLASQQNTPFIAQFGKPIPFQISQTNSPFIKYLSQKGENTPFLQQSYSSPNSSIHIGKQLSSQQQQQTFPSPITKQQDVTPSFHTPNNTHILHNVITPNSTDKQHCSVLYSSPNEFERNIFPDPSNLISTPERLNSTPTADHTSEELLTASPVHKSIMLVTTDRLPESITDNFINSQSQSPDLLSGFSFQIPEAIKPSVVELAEIITEQPNEYHSIPNSPITAAPHSDSQNNHMLSSPVKVSVDISNSPVHTPTRSDIQDTIITFPVTDKTGLHTVTEAHSPLRTSLIRSHEQLSPVIEPCKDSSNNTSPIPTPPISHNSPVIDITPHTTQSLTSMVTPEYQQPASNSAEISILIEEDSMPENPPVQTDHIKHPLPADIQTIVIPDDSPKKIPEVKKDSHRPRQLYPKRIHSNLSSKMNTHNITLPTTDTPSMGNFFNHFPKSQPGSKPQFMYPSTRNNLARSTKFQEFDTVTTSQFKYFPQTSALNSFTSKSKAFANQIPKDYDTFFNFILNQTQEQQRQKLDISKCSNDSQISLQENISSLNGGSQPFPSPQSTNKHDTFSSISQTDNTPNVHDNNLKGTLLSTDNKIDNIVVDSDSLLPGENDEVEILLTPVSIPKFDSPTVTEQETCVVVEDWLETCDVVEDLLANSVVVEDLLETCVVVEDLQANNVGNGDECEHIEMSHSQPADSVSNMSQTDTPMVTATEEISLSHSESKIPENGDVSMLNDGDITPADHLTNSQSNNSIPSLISSSPHTDVNTIDVHSMTTMLVSPNNTELSPHINTSVIIQELPLPSNTGKFDIFDIKDSPTNLSLPSPKHTKITSPTILSRFVTLQSYTPNHKYENTQPYNTPPACSQFSQMNEVLSLARDLENRISKNETIDSDTDSIFSLTQNSPKTNSNNFISYLSLSPKIRTFPTPPSVAREMVQGMERFNSPLGVSIFDYADMGIDENINVIPHFSPSIGSPPTLNPVKRRANTYQSKKLKLEKYKHIEQQASRILSPKKANEISNFSNRPFRNRGKSRYKHRPFQAN